jgi:hypothetical protein
MLRVKMTVLGYYDTQTDRNMEYADPIDVQADACFALASVDFKELKDIYGEFTALQDGDVMSFRVSGTYTVNAKTDVVDEALELAENKFYKANFGPLVNRELLDMVVVDSKGRILASEEF